MFSTIESINSVADCNTLLAIANEIKADIEFKRQSTDRRQNSLETRSNELNGAMSSLQLEIDSINSQINTLGEGPDKEVLITKRMGLEYKLRKLGERVDDYGLFVVILKDNQVERYDAELQKHQLFIDAIQQRITQLNAGSN